MVINNTINSQNLPKIQSNACNEPSSSKAQKFFSTHITELRDTIRNTISCKTQSATATLREAYTGISHLPLVQKVFEVNVQQSPMDPIQSKTGFKPNEVELIRDAMQPYSYKQNPAKLSIHMYKNKLTCSPPVFDIDYLGTNSGICNHLTYKTVNKLQSLFNPSSQLPKPADGHNSDLCNHEICTIFKKFQSLFIPSKAIFIPITGHDDGFFNQDGSNHCYILGFKKPLSKEVRSFLNSLQQKNRQRLNLPAEALIIDPSAGRIEASENNTDKKSYSATSIIDFSQHLSSQDLSYFNLHALGRIPVKPASLRIPYPIGKVSTILPALKNSNAKDNLVILGFSRSLKTQLIEASLVILDCNGNEQIHKNGFDPELARVIQNIEHNLNHRPTHPLEPFIREGVSYLNLKNDRFEFTYKSSKPKIIKDETELLPPKLNQPWHYHRSLDDNWIGTARIKEAAMHSSVSNRNTAIEKLKEIKTQMDDIDPARTKGKYKNETEWLRTSYVGQYFVENTNG